MSRTNYVRRKNYVRAYVRSPQAMVSSKEKLVHSQRLAIVASSREALGKELRHVPVVDRRVSTDKLRPPVGLEEGPGEGIVGGFEGSTGRCPHLREEPA